MDGASLAILSLEEEDATTRKLKCKGRAAAREGGRSLVSSAPHTSDRTFFDAGNRTEEKKARRRAWPRCSLPPCRSLPY